MRIISCNECSHFWPANNPRHFGYRILIVNGYCTRERSCRGGLRRWSWSHMPSSVSRVPILVCTKNSFQLCVQNFCSIHYFISRMFTHFIVRVCCSRCFSCVGWIIWISSYSYWYFLIDMSFQIQWPGWNTGVPRVGIAHEEGRCIHIACQLSTRGSTLTPSCGHHQGALLPVIN